MDSNTKRFIIETLMWIGIYFGLAFIFSRILPFPYSLIAIVSAVIGLGYYRRRRYLRTNYQASTSNTSHFGDIFGSKSGISYYCMNCGAKHNLMSCPHCGSKLKKAGF
ncbi:MAG: hypothetical protein M3270_02765 [Thermoproteota archaeon]|nr:hypothetical protein [Thermoproteota archaeon]